jgi:hypothetical protein
VRHASQKVDVLPRLREKVTQQERRQVVNMAKNHSAQMTTTPLPALGLTALRQWAAQITAMAQSLKPTPRAPAYFPLPQTKPDVGEKGDAHPLASHEPLQKTRAATETVLSPHAILQPEMVAPPGFTVQVPSPTMPLLGRNGRIVLCRLGN